MLSKTLTGHLADALVSSLAAPLGSIDQVAGDEARRRLLRGARGLAAKLTGDDEPTARDTAERIMGAVWRGRHAPAAWWDSELGQACARALDGSNYGLAVVSRAVAASMLGISVSRVDQMSGKGQLAKSGSGIPRASILQLIVDPRRRMFRKAHEL